MSDKKIAILGTGANGASVGADLTRAGLDVTLIEQWPANVEAMRAHGITVETPDGTTRTPVRAIHLCDVATLRERFDVVFLVVKAYDTRWACELVKPYVKPDGLVVGLQNGMTVDVVRDVMGPARSLAAVIEIAAAMWEPGLVERHTPPSGTWFALGADAPAARGREKEVADLLRHAGTVETVEDIRSAKWMKLVVNAAELVPSAILDLPLKAAAEVPGMHEFMLRAGKEAVRAAVAGGHRIVPIFGLRDVDPAAPERFVEVMLDAVYTRWSLPHTKTTVLQDWQKGRHSEVDELNGFVLAEHRRLLGDAPANARTVELAHRIESGDLPARPSNAELLLASL
ncbi:2-dehydropantoate 2-reductase [Streptomyces sp. NPDC047000]|uniref:ketopantoate reductase family protein n=1 Tax=Streptomyces sp. NPDC047000 TaxID=3155474 RepID=UPI003407AA1E